MTNEQRKTIVCKAVRAGKWMLDMPSTGIPRIFSPELDCYFYVNYKTGDLYSDMSLMKGNDEPVDRLSPNALVTDPAKIAQIDKGLVLTLTGTIQTLTGCLYDAVDGLGREVDND